MNFASATAQLYAAAAAIALAVIGTTAFNIDGVYKSEVQTILTTGDKAAQKLAFRTTELLDAVNQTTLVIKYLVEQSTPVRLDSLQQAGVLATEVRGSVYRTDHRGFVVDSTTSAVALNVADEDEFKLHLKTADLDVTVGQARPNPVTKVWVVPVSRTVQHQGGFGGIITAEVSSALLTDAFAKMESNGTAVGVLGEDGYYRSRQVGTRNDAGRFLDVESLKRRATVTRTELVPQMSPVDNTYRFLSLVKVDKYPLYAIVAQDAGQALADFRHTRQYIVQAAGALLVLPGVTWSRTLRHRASVYFIATRWLRGNGARSRPTLCCPSMPLPASRCAGWRSLRTTACSSRARTLACSGR